MVIGDELRRAWVIALTREQAWIDLLTSLLA
jgi:hypothetical protein